MNWEMVGGLIRHVLTFGGGFLVTNGVLEAAQLETVIGAVIALGGVAWSLWHKGGIAARIDAALKG